MIILHLSVLYPLDTELDTIKTVPECKTDAKYLSWQLKHINEVVAVNMVTTFIFDFERQLCDKKQCKMIKKNDVVDGQVCYVFDSFDDQRKLLMKKLTYYFAYRAIAPKVIEHVLEGYSFHPAWGLTGAHWNTTMSEDLDEE